MCVHVSKGGLKNRPRLTPTIEGLLYPQEVMQYKVLYCSSLTTRPVCADAYLHAPANGTLTSTPDNQIRSDRSRKTICAQLTPTATVRGSTSSSCAPANEHAGPQLRYRVRDSGFISGVVSRGVRRKERGTRADVGSGRGGVGFSFYSRAGSRFFVLIYKTAMAAAAALVYRCDKCAR